MYHVSYDDVPTDEAIDLIHTLPDGSAWVSKTYPLRSWSAERHRSADVLDAISTLTWALAMDHDKMPEPLLTTRPRDAWARAQEGRRAVDARGELESDDWEEM